MTKKKKVKNSKKIKKSKIPNKKAKAIKLLKHKITKKTKLNNKHKETTKSGIFLHDHQGYIRIGIPGFDELFHKDYGVPVGASVLVEGGPGSGKTIFCLAAVNALCKKGKKCLYMSFEEPEEKLVNHMSHFGWKGEEFVKKGLLRLKRFDALDVSRSVEALLSAAKKELLIDVDPVLFPKDFEPDFIILDSLTSIAAAFSGRESRFRVYMEQLFRYLEHNKITNFLIREVSSPAHLGSTFKEKGEAVSFLSDGIIDLYNVIYKDGTRKSAMEILKMRGTGFKRQIVEMEIIDKKGLIIHPTKIFKKGAHEEFKFT